MTVGSKSNLKPVGVKPKLKISWLSWNKIMALTKMQYEDKTYGKTTKRNYYEVTSFGIMDPNDPCRLLDIWVPPQENTHTRTTPDMAAHIDWVVEMREKGIGTGQLNLWHHSHCDFDVFWSGTDISTIEAYQGDGLQWAIVTNIKGEYRVRADMFTPIRYWWDDCELEIEQPMLEGLDEWFAAQKDKIKNGTDTPVIKGYQGNLYGVKGNNWSGGTNWAGSSYGRVDSPYGHRGHLTAGVYKPKDKKNDDKVFEEIDFSSITAGEITDPAIVVKDKKKEVLHLSHPSLQEAFDYDVISEKEALELEHQYVTGAISETVMLRSILHLAEDDDKLSMADAQMVLEELPELELVEDNGAEKTYGLKKDDDPEKQVAEPEETSDKEQASA